MSITRREALRGGAAAAGALTFGQFFPADSALAQAQAKAKSLNLKITGLKTFLTEPRSIFVKVYTNQGLVGLGVSVQTGKEQTVAAAIMQNEPLLVGRDPTRIERIWEDLYEGPRWRGGPLTAAISAIDIALWDILGQAVGQPIHVLLGGAVRDRIRVYQSAGGAMTPDAWAKLKGDGFTAARIQWPRGTVPEMIAAVKEWRAAAGPGYEFAIHGAGTLPTSDAIHFMRGVEECDLMWVEEPIQMDDIEDWALLRQHTSTPSATGERLTTKFAFNPLLTRHLIDFAQPDLAACGGITEARKIAAIAEANRIRIAPHGPHGPAGAFANFHFDAVTPNFYIQEIRDYTNQADLDLHDGMVPMVKDGYCALPDRPGLGTVLNEKVAARRAYKQLNVASGVGLSSGVSARDAVRAGGDRPSRPGGE